MSTAVDRIEKKVTLRAPLSRVWRALADAKEFGAWFGVEFEGTFVEDGTLRGKVTSPKGYEHVTVEVQVTRLEPERYFAYRWHPYAIEAGVDYSAEPTTLVEFVLESAGAATHLTIVESGFGRIPVARRAVAFRMNDSGWSEQIHNIARHVAGA